MADLTYQTGFGNEHESEALPGALPIGRRSPQRPPYGLFAEQLSGTAFTAPRDHNRRTWFYRMRPSASRGGFSPIDSRSLISAPIAGPPTPAQQLRWSPFPVPDSPADFVDGLTTLAVNGDVKTLAGIGIHIYLANRSMEDRYFFNGDGEMLVVPESGRLRIHTECGVLEAAPGYAVILPRGMVFRVVLLDDEARGYVCENYGLAFQLPERGPVGSDGFANERDFEAPVAAYEERDDTVELVMKFGGGLHSTTLDQSPLDVVAWWGNHVPYRYELSRFTTMGTVSYDHPDPSIYTVLTSPSDTPGVANADFVIFPPRWLVGEDTFRPPPYHRNVMSEFMGLVYGVYDAKPEGFRPGGASLHNCLIPHGPAAEVQEAASTMELAPQKLDDTLAIMFESRFVIQPTAWALESPQLQQDYAAVTWQSIAKRFTGEP